MAKLVTIRGINEMHAQRLQAVGIRSVEDLLEAGRTSTGGRELAQRTQIGERSIRRWLDHADLRRVKGIGPEFAELLLDSGVKSLQALARRNAKKLLESLQAQNAAGGLVRRMPTLSEVESWVEQARNLSAVVGYGGGEERRWSARKHHGQKAKPPQPGIDFGDPSAFRPQPEPRWLQAEVFEIAGDGQVPLERGLRAGAEHRLDVWIGPQQAGAIRAPEMFPEDLLPRDREIYELQILFWEARHVPQPQIGTIWLPKGEGKSTTCAFHFRARPDVPDFEARLLVMYGNRMLQTMLLAAPVLADPAAAPEGAQIAFRLDTPVRASPAGLDPAQPRGPAIFADTPAGAAPQMAAVAGDRVALRSLEGVDRTIKAIRSRLEQIASAPDAFASLGDEATVALLRFLARQGRLLYSAIAETYLADFDLAEDLPIQVVSARESFLPIEFMYDRPSPAPDATLCPGAAAALALPSGKCTACAGYTEDEARQYVCPLGFWCMRRVIERHAVRPVAETGLEGAEYAMEADPTEGRSTLSVLSSAVYAASNRVKPDDVEALRGSLAAATSEHVAYVQDWAAWRQAVQAGNPSLLVLLPHTLRDDDQIPTLEIGDLQQLPEIDITWQDVRKAAAAPPVVLLLGCETAVPDIPFQDFATQFRVKGAAIVLHTLAPVLGRHVVPVAQMLVEQLKSAAEAGGTFGSALLQVRRRGLAAGLPVVLSLVAYGDADWGIRR